MSTGPRRLVVAGLVVALAGAAFAWYAVRPRAAGELRVPPPGLPLTVLDDDRPMPEFRLSGTHGEVTRSTFAGHWTFVFFGYTHCPDVCPTTLALMKAVRSGLPQPERPQVLFVSVDPARDTDELLASYVPAFDPEFIAATGPDEALAPLLEHFGVMFRRNEPARNGFYTVDHTAAVFLVDPRARLKASFSPPFTAESVLAGYRRLSR